MNSFSQRTLSLFSSIRIRCSQILKLDGKLFDESEKEFDCFLSVQYNSAVASAQNATSEKQA